MSVMTAPTMETICRWSHGHWQAQAADVVIEDLVIDSRSIDRPAGSLFIALKTSLRDGHNYIADTYSKGVRNFLVSNDIDVAAYPDANIIKVADTLRALQQIAAAHRKQFDIPVVGVTGSNGKTIVKDWLYQLM